MTLLTKKFVWFPNNNVFRILSTYVFTGSHGTAERAGDVDVQIVYHVVIDFFCSMMMDDVS